jgi:hypothetical protein
MFDNLAVILRGIDRQRDNPHRSEAAPRGATTMQTSMKSSDTPTGYKKSFIAEIPAFPGIMPCLFGVVLLRRAGNVHR